MFAVRVKGPKVFPMFARNARRAAEVAGLFWSVSSQLGEKYHVLTISRSRSVFGWKMSTTQ